jgi:hypothetical protein
MKPLKVYEADKYTSWRKRNHNCMVVWRSDPACQAGHTSGMPRRPDSLQPLLADLPVPRKHQLPQGVGGGCHPRASQGERQGGLSV